MAQEMMAEMPETTEHDEESREMMRARTLDKIAMSLIRHRTEAIAGRRNSGIEQEWMEDEEHYEGVDDANRGESAWREKPVGQAALPAAEDTDSTAFLNVTRPYCDAAAARMGDMLLPTDDRAFSIKPTPIAEMVQIANGKVPRRIQRQINEGFPQDEQGQQLAAQTTQQLIDEAKAEQEEATEKAQNAERQIDDWLTEAQYHREVRAVIEDSSRVGAGVLKGPIPEMRVAVAYMDGGLKVQKKIAPGSKRVDCWNCFPDPACGENIHRGSYFWERDTITAKELAYLMGGDYFDDQIKRVIKEGPHKATDKIDEYEHWWKQGLTKEERSRLFEIWYYHGTLDREDLEAMDIEVDNDQDIINISLTMVNNRVIKASMNHLDTGEFPYDFMIWQKRKGSPWGIGVSRQIRTPQRIINAGIRNMLDNAGIAAGPMLAFKQGLIRPADGIAEIAPRKMWIVSEDANIDDVKKAFAFFEVPMMQVELQAILMLGLKIAEDVTGLPQLLQGQQGQSPDTVGGMQLMHNNASTVLRRIARLFDDLITEPHIRRYYNYLLQYGEDDNMKGDFQIDARGSSALVERDIQNMALLQLGQLIQNPLFGKDPKKWMDEYLKSQRLDPKRFDFEDEQWQQIVENWQQILQAGQEQQEDPRLQVAQLNAQVAQQKMEHESMKEDKRSQLQITLKQMSQELDVLKKQIDTENEQLREAGKAELSMTQIQARYQEHQEKLQANLADTIMKLETQERLSKVESRPGTKEVAKPPSEPAGRASPGNAYQE